MTYFYELKLTQNEILLLKTKLENKTKTENECRIWTGQKRRGYGMLEFSLRGKRQKQLVHRLNFYLENNCEKIERHMHISHLCHNKLCLEISHLSLEPAHINNQRKICKNSGECTNHYGYARCLI